MDQATVPSQVITQVGIIVRNIESAAAKVAALFGLPVPQSIITGPQEEAQTLYRGQPTAARAKLAFFNMGSLQLELIEPLGGPSTWQEYLDAHGQGIHHVAFQIKGMQKVTTELEAAGVPLVQKGEYPGGRYAYLDATGQFGAILELLEND